MFFGFDLSLEARAEILKIFCLCFWRNDNLINLFWDLLTFKVNQNMTFFGFEIWKHGIWNIISECLAWWCHYVLLHFWVIFLVILNILLSSSRALSLSIPVDNTEATWKKATKYNKYFFRNKTFLFFKIESWNFEHLFE